MRGMRVAPLPPVRPNVRVMEQWLMAEASPLELAAVLAAASARLQALAHEKPTTAPVLIDTRPMSGEEFFSRRQAAHLTMDREAALLGVSLKSIWRWENGIVSIPTVKAVAIRSAMPRLQPEAVA
jgi:DNA-binding transcriptional regulator YiaG